MYIEEGGEGLKTGIWALNFSTSVGAQDFQRLLCRVSLRRRRPHRRPLFLSIFAAQRFPQRFSPLSLLRAASCRPLRIQMLNAAFDSSTYVDER